MSRLVSDCILIAQRSPLDSLVREFQQRHSRWESGYVTTGLLVLLGVLLTLWLVSSIWERFDGRHPIDSSRMLLLSLCKAHGLCWSDRWLLWRVARAWRLKEPAQLFLEPERLDPEQLPPALRPRKERLELLRERLFAGLGGDEMRSPEPADPEQKDRKCSSDPREAEQPPAKGAPAAVPTASAEAQQNPFDLPWWPSARTSSDDPPSATISQPPD